MSPKKITVVEDASGAESTAAIGSEAGYRSLLNRLQVSFLVHAEGGFHVYDFEALADGDRYTPGPPQQQQNGEWSCCSRKYEFTALFDCGKQSLSSMQENLCSCQILPDLSQFRFLIFS